MQYYEWLIFEIFIIEEAGLLYLSSFLVFSPFIFSSTKQSAKFQKDQILTNDNLIFYMNNNISAP